MSWSCWPLELGQLQELTEEGLILVAKGENRPGLAMTMWDYSNLRRCLHRRCTVPVCGCGELMTEEVSAVS
jgi:hypothetical protein